MWVLGVWRKVWVERGEEMHVAEGLIGCSILVRRRQERGESDHEGVRGG